MEGYILGRSIQWDMHMPHYDVELLVEQAQLVARPVGAKAI